MIMMIVINIIIFILLIIITIIITSTNVVLSISHLSFLQTLLYFVRVVIKVIALSIVALGYTSF